MAAEEVKGMERMLGGRKRQKREVKETRVDRWLSLPLSSLDLIPDSFLGLLEAKALRVMLSGRNGSPY